MSCFHGRVIHRIHGNSLSRVRGERLRLGLCSLRTFSGSHLSSTSVRRVLGGTVGHLPREYHRVFVVDHLRGLHCGRVTRGLGISPGAIRGRVIVTLHGLGRSLGSCFPLFIFVV